MRYEFITIFVFSYRLFLNIIKRSKLSLHKKVTKISIKKNTLKKSGSYFLYFILGKNERFLFVGTHKLIRGGKKILRKSIFAVHICMINKL